MEGEKNGYKNKKDKQRVRAGKNRQGEKMERRRQRQLVAIVLQRRLSVLHCASQPMDADPYAPD